MRSIFLKVRLAQAAIFSAFWETELFGFFVDSRIVNRHKIICFVKLGYLT